MTELKKCPDCGAIAVEQKVQLESWEVAGGIKLHARLPIWECTECEFAYIEGTTEFEEHDIECKFRGVLTPAEVAKLREELELSQEDVAKALSVSTEYVDGIERRRYMQSVVQDRMLRDLYRVA